MGVNSKSVEVSQVVLKLVAKPKAKLKIGGGVSGGAKIGGGISGGVRIGGGVSGGAKIGGGGKIKVKIGGGAKVKVVFGAAMKGKLDFRNYFVPNLWLKDATCRASFKTAYNSVMGLNYSRLAFYNYTQKCMRALADVKSTIACSVCDNQK